MSAVANWFRRKISIATGIMTCGFGFSGLLVPVLVRLIDIYGWRTAMGILAMGMIAICLPLSLLVRHKPERYGYLPDGEVSGAVIGDKRCVPAQTLGVDVRAKQALRSSAFWHIALALMCQSMALGAVITHVMPYLSSIGIARATSSLVASAIPLASIGGRLGCGWLGDKLDSRRVTAVAFALLSLGLLFFGCTSTGAAWLLVPFFVLFGIGYGGNNTLRASLIREFFGRSNFGTIHGFMIAVMMLGSITGPLLAGQVFDNCGSYKLIWFVFAGLAVGALFMVATTPHQYSQK